MSKNRIYAQDVSKYFIHGDQKSIILNQIIFSAEQGKTYAITGVSGTGKSTLMHLLGGLDKPSTGTIFYNQKDIATLPEKEYQLLLNREYGLVFQLPYLIKELSVVENVMVPGLIAKKPESECKKNALELLEQVGLLEKASEKPSILSGGEQQRVALARALLNKPAFLLADEPTGNIDLKTGNRMVDLLISLQKKHGMAIIVTTHDDYVAQRMEYRYELRNGVLRQTN